MRNHKIHYSFVAFNLLLCIPAITFVSAQWLFAWILATTIHEFGHLIMLQICGIRIFSIRLGVIGTEIVSESMTPQVEAVCAIAGPVAGLSTIFLRNIWPHIALIGMIQSLYNLIPVGPLDGGRFLNCILQCVWSSKIVSMVTTAINCMVIILFLAAGMWLTIQYRLGVWPILFPVLPILLTIWKNSLHCSEKNSTIR